MVMVILLDLAVPDLPDVFGLCGSLGLSLCCYVVPGYVCMLAGQGLLSKIVGVLSVSSLGAHSSSCKGLSLGTSKQPRTPKERVEPQLLAHPCIHRGY